MSDEERECLLHGLVRHFHPKNTYKSWRCRKCAADAVKRRRKAVKVILVEEAGGKCAHCGYDKCVEALVFHHLDPSEKEFGLTGDTRSLERSRAEAKKCVLLCMNCHAEEHARLHAG